MSPRRDRRYWNRRYKRNLGSGSGSRGALAQYKVEFINDIFERLEVGSCLDFGAGDGFVASGLQARQLEVTDISKVARKQLSTEYGLRVVHPFCLNLKRYDMVISLDVLFHITSQKEFLRYMRKMTAMADRYILIYSAVKLPLSRIPEHMANNDFMSFMHTEREWKILEEFDSPHSFDSAKPHTTSPSRFVLYEKRASDD